MGRELTYGKAINVRWDFDTTLWKQVDRTLEAINHGDKFFLNHIEALLRMVNTPSFVGDEKSKAGIYDDVSKRYVERMKKIDRDLKDAVTKNPKGIEQATFNAGLRRLNAVMSLLDERHKTPQRAEFSDVGDDE